MAVHTPEIIEAYHDAIPLNRYGSEVEIGHMITYLCSEKASYVSGQVIAVDGGFESTGVGLPALRNV
jgi:meso-butanediol dehydrogenase / (S,S)-butanediol dehydrogenase / diacetyl reductase